MANKPYKKPAHDLTLNLEPGKMQPKIIREISRALFFLGAFFGITAGLGFFIYDIQYFAKNQLFMKQWGGKTVKVTLGYVIGTSVVGFLYAVMEMAVLALIIKDGKWNVFLYTQLSTLFFAPIIITMSILVMSDYGMGGAKNEELTQRPQDPMSTLTPIPVWVEDLYILSAKGEALVARDSELLTYDDNWNTQFEEMLKSCDNPEECRQQWNAIETYFLCSNALKPGFGWYDNVTEWVYIQPTRPLFVPDMSKSRVPLGFPNETDPTTWSEGTCNQFSIFVKSYKGGWSSKAVNNYIRDSCKTSVKLMRDQRELENLSDEELFSMKAAERRAGALTWESPSACYLMNSTFLGFYVFSVAAAIAGLFVDHYVPSTPNPNPNPNPAPSQELNAQEKADPDANTDPNAYENPDPCL